MLEIMNLSMARRRIISALYPRIRFSNDRAPGILLRSKFQAAVRFLFSLGACSGFPVFPGTVAAQEFDNELEDEIQAVKVGLRLIDITKIDNREETFTVEGILYIDWQDESPETEPGDWGEEAVDDQLKKLDWWPSPEFENGRGIRERSGMFLSIYEDGSVEYEERFSLTLSSELDLRHFPFDQQQLPIKIIIAGAPEDSVQIEISEYSPGLVRLPQWQFNDDSFQAGVETGIKPYDAEDSPLFNRALFTIEIQRR